MNEDSPETDVKPHLKEGFKGYCQILWKMLDGTLDTAKYEDSCRAMMGNQCFVLCTMDKVVGSTVKALQQLVHDKAFGRLVSLYKWLQAQPEVLPPPSGRFPVLYFVV